MTAEDGPAAAPAVVLLSGGLDSVTLLAHVASYRSPVYALSVHYGQKNSSELQHARTAAIRHGVAEHLVVDVDPRLFGDSALTDPDRGVPHRHRDPLADGGLPPTYVPGRNTLFLAVALSWAESLGADAVFLGISVGDARHAGDCSAAYVEAYNGLLRVAAGRAALEVCTPFLAMTKAEIITLGAGLGVDYRSTLSCYEPTADGFSCGTCDACLVRRHGFASLGTHDPARRDEHGWLR